ncbi:MAG: UDP-N-acetylglucosamine 2-epimerase (non-hydrolyzing) [Thermodesulfobacteriota bacterium]
MGKKHKLLLVAGARPNFMKIAPLIWAIKKNERGVPSERELEFRVVHTGQHYDEKMSGIFFRELGIPKPDLNLEVGSGSHAEQTGRVMIAFEPVCLREKPDWVVVVGDVNSTMACTLVAGKLGIKVAHIEAGLRSFDRTMPEEINRLVTDALADLLLTPSVDADENLKREGICGSKIKRVGNIMIDTLVANLEKAHASRLPEQLGLSPKNFAYVTLHRPSNVDDRENLRFIMEELNFLSRKIPIIFPIHPRTRKMIKHFGIPVENGRSFQLLEPVGYHDSLWLTENAALVLTDSGGLQEESTYLQTPCLTLRPNTERPITIDLGTNKLTRLDRLRGDIQEILENRSGPGGIPPLWDGHTADRILDVLIEKT